MVDEARKLLAAGAGAGWAPSVVILSRKALEAGLMTFYASRPKTLGLLDGSGHDRLICLPHYLRENDAPHPLAAKVAWCWAALSDASHHRGLEMTPSAKDLTAWLDTVESFVALLEE